MTENGVNDYQKAQKWLEGFDWDNDPEVECNLAVICGALQEIPKYRAIGTVEECREAMEKQRAKKPNLYGDFEDGKLLCPNCKEDLMDLIDCGYDNCPYCGQAIDRRDIDD